MLIVNIFVTLLFVILGIMFSAGKGIDLVAGYNTLSKEEKEKIDQKTLCKYMTILMFLLAACWVVLSIGIEISKMWLFWCGFGLFICVVIFFVIYINTGNRLGKKE